MNYFENLNPRVRRAIKAIIVNGFGSMSCYLVLVYLAESFILVMCLPGLVFGVSQCLVFSEVLKRKDFSIVLSLTFSIHVVSFLLTFAIIGFLGPATVFVTPVIGAISVYFVILWRLGFSADYRNLAYVGLSSVVASALLFIVQQLQIDSGVFEDLSVDPGFFYPLWQVLCGLTIWKTIEQSIKTPSDTPFKPLSLDSKP